MPFDMRTTAIKLNAFKDSLCGYDSSLLVTVYRRSKAAIFHCSGHSCYLITSVQLINILHAVDEELLVFKISPTLFLFRYFFVP